MKLYAPVLLCLGLFLAVTPARAEEEELTIQITQGVEGAIPIVIMPIGSRTISAPENLAAIIMEDLRRSGRFESVTPGALPNRPTEVSQLDFPSLRALKADYVVVGEVRPSPKGGYGVRFQLAEVYGGNPLLGYTFDVAGDELRRLAHHISDLIYEKLTGEPGAFDSRIAYVTVTQEAGKGRRYSLAVADSDGYNPFIVLRSPEPVLSPAWSPDGNRLAYVSFENRKSQIIIQDVYTGTRQTVTDYPGINGAPAWSPDGRRLALTLSKDGNPEIYLCDLASRKLTRLTEDGAVDTEPAWAPDGNSLVFTSDRGGSPQLYRVAASGGQPERLTFEGDYNARARLSSDGRYLAFVQREQGRFRIALMDMQSGQIRPLSEGELDESPGFAPNNRMVIYATSQEGRGVLAAVSVDGRVRQSLAARGGDVREPAWGPRTAEKY